MNANQLQSRLVELCLAHNCILIRINQGRKAHVAFSRMWYGSPLLGQILPELEASLAGDLQKEQHSGIWDNLILSPQGIIWVEIKTQDKLSRKQAAFGLALKKMGLQHLVLESEMADKHLILLENWLQSP